jgi:hypothetical protein
MKRPCSPQAIPTTFNQHKPHKKPNHTKNHPNHEKTLLTIISIAALSASAGFGQVVINVGTYTQNFNSIGSGLPTGWDVRTGATASALGTVASFTPAANTWANTSGAFKNLASATGLPDTATTAEQDGSTNRALGIRQTGSFGDPGASFNFNFSTTGVQITTISLDLMMLSVQPRSTTWTIQYGLGATPTSFVNLGTYADPGTFGTTGFSVTNSVFGTALDNQSSVWFRVVALSGSTGSGNRDTFGIDNFSVVAIPEPGSILLFGLGATALLIRRKMSKVNRA